MSNTTVVPALQLLQRAFDSSSLENPSGERVRLIANISTNNSEALRKMIVARKPQLVIEIGMAMGISTLSILSGLQQNGSGRLISIDPYVDWQKAKAIALHQVAQAGAESMHEHWELASYVALPRILEQGLQPDFIYIDGNHNFDYVFTDFFFADKLLNRGGIVGFNDCGWRPVYKVIRFLRVYRRYREIEAGLPKKYKGRNVLYSLIKRIEGRSTFDRYFEKLEQWEPDHGFNRGF